MLLAVSGGSDSLALLKAAAARGDAQFSAATVDHGLRAASAEEAQWVARACRDAGIEHVVLTWAGEKPASGLQEAARLARYRLLASEAERRGCDGLMTAHTSDDQAETVFMRLARGSGPRGLAGMAARADIAAGAGRPVPLLRPFLALSREELRAGLARLAQPYIDDPSNDDPRFERVRVRGLLAALEAQGLLTRAALVATADRMHAAQARLDAADRAAFAGCGGVFHQMGFARINAGPAPARLVARLIRAVGGGDYAPPEEEAARALDQALEAGAATLGGALLKRQGGALYICREAAALLGRADVAPLAPARLGPRERMLWDRRFIIENREAEPFEVVPCGADSEALARTAALHALPKEILAAAPLVRLIAEIRPEGAPLGLPAYESLLAERFDANVMRIP